ncbi:hypothetical protein [Beijerinckia mobilis]|uniref:hypothetical protein n=1 Tax=Beijerinckia mobilis TaxID=231434 RepID=UPI00054E8E2B|nr:hypothetical protein [Beijerinckia mobilis]
MTIPHEYLSMATQAFDEDLEDATECLCEYISEGEPISLAIDGTGRKIRIPWENALVYSKMANEAGVPLDEWLEGFLKNAAKDQASLNSVLDALLGPA